MFCRKLHFLILLVACALGVAAQSHSSFTSVQVPSRGKARPFPSIDRHVENTSLGILYVNSAFAHGYRHGYEHGFHIGDLDVHMGRAPRLSFKQKERQPGAREYDTSFGSKQLFQQGYTAGFQNGYGDAIAGLEFRATPRLRSAAAGLGDVLPPTRRASFDEGFGGGFRSSQTHDAPMVHVTADYVEQYCRRIISASYGFEYCSGFSRGYMLGTFSGAGAGSKIASSQMTGH
jgi:hypothetical protein